MDKKRLSIIVLAVYLVGMLVFAILPHVGESLPKGSDKVFHFSEFAVLTVLLLVTASFYGLKKEKSYVLIPLIAIVVAVLSELVQIPLPSRTFSWFDMLADFIGITVGMVCTWIFFRR
jgi:VanZ family protein